MYSTKFQRICWVCEHSKYLVGLLLNCKLIGSTQSYLFEEWEVAESLCITTKLSKWWLHYRSWSIPSSIVVVGNDETHGGDAIKCSNQSYVNSILLPSRIREITWRKSGREIPLSRAHSNLLYITSDVRISESFGQYWQRKRIVKYCHWTISMRFTFHRLSRYQMFWQILD